MAEKLVITLGEKATARYLQLARQQTKNEVDASCEPSGVCLTVEIGGILGAEVSLDGVEIGTALVGLVES